MNLKKLNGQSEEYSIPQENIDKKEAGRLSFISKFPIDSLKDLSVDQYVQGTDENSFCYWLEFKKILFGIGGGNASKFGLYKAAKDGNYYKGAAINKEQISGLELQNYFEKIKNGILTALEYTATDQIDKIKTIDTPLWNMVLQKILSIYYPDKFLTIGSPDVLIECARNMEIPDIELNPRNSIQINYECKKVLTALSEYKDWPYEKLGSFIWENYVDASKRNYYIIGSKYGEHADKDIFPEMLKKSVIATGFASKINLEEYYHENNSEISAYLKEQGEEPKSYNALKHFLTLKAGDRIAIKADGSPKGSNGFLSIVGIAEVVEKDGKIYRHEPDGLGHLINVKFLKGPVYKEFELGGYGRTIQKLSKPEHIDLIFKADYPDVHLFEQTKSTFPEEVFNNYIYHLRKMIDETGIKINDKRVVFSVGDNLNFTVGQRYSFNIFYSNPQGVYGVISKNILKENNVQYDGKPPQPYFNYYQNFTPNSAEWDSIIQSINEELARTTKSGYQRHNNSDFENYVFGLEPNKRVENMNYPLNTIFYGPPGTGKTYNTVVRAAEIIENREIASHAEALEIFKKHLHDRIEFITFHQNYSYEDFIQGLRPDTDNDKELTFKKRDGVFKKISDRALKNIQESEKAPEVISQSIAFQEALEILKDKIIESDVPVKINETAYLAAVEEDAFRYTGDNWTLNQKGFNGFRMKYSDLIRFSEADIKERKDIKTLDNVSGLSKQHASYFFKTYEIVKSLMPKTALESAAIPRQNYVLIIDEINRANISRVFGELITLIECDKRSHGSMPMEAKLPSGDIFKVPSNLYIIGTMNTADKSIALLDIALRRRFEFEAMYPIYKIDGHEIPDATILRKINEQIIKSKGYDFQIGHSYFMDKDTDLVQRMNKKVIPLLLEYYMNDEKEVKGILSNAGLKIEENSWPLKMAKKND